MRTQSSEEGTPIQWEKPDEGEEFLLGGGEARRCQGGIGYIEIKKVQLLKIIGARFLIV